MIPDLVSTIIPVFNRPSMLRQAVNSVLEQFWRPIEVIIVDDGSTDETPSVAREFAQANPEIVRYLRIDNAGPGAAREAGRKLAKGEFIQYLDSDDRLLPDKFAIQVAALRQRPLCGVAYGRTRLIDADGRTLRESFKWTGMEEHRLFPRLLVDRWWCTHTPLYRRAVTDMVGPWSRLRYSQDWEYDARVGAMKIELAFCDAHVSEHRDHEQVRITRTGSWLDPSDRAWFFEQLFSHASLAGVTGDTPEMRHFSRWVFRHARECGLSGDVKSARRCAAVALKAAESGGADIRLYQTLAEILGWKFLGRLAFGCDALKGRAVGDATLKQSWMAADEPA